MEAILTEDWLRGIPDEAQFLIQDIASLTLVRDAIRKLGTTTNTPDGVIDRACLVATEIGTNQLRHALSGTIAVQATARDGGGGSASFHRGIQVIGVDRGQGLLDLASALDANIREGSSSDSLGVGVGAIRRLSTDVDFDVRVSEGTRIAARIFGPDAPKRLEVGVCGRPFPGEFVNGDHASFRRNADRVFVSICDGLGHGRAAREASDVAMRVFDEAHDATPTHSADEIIARLHAALGATRGAVVGLGEISEGDASTLRACTIGNIDVQVCGPRHARRLSGTAGVLGTRQANPFKLRPETVPLARGDRVIFTTDGITSKLSLDSDLDLLRSHPAVIAQRIIERFARDNDDALALVVG